LLRQPTAAPRNTTRAKALVALAALHEAKIESLQAEPFAREGLEIYKELGDQPGIAFALLMLGSALCGHDDYVAGRPLIFESLALYRTLGNKVGIANVLNLLGNFADEQDPARARVYLEESLALTRELGDTAGVANRLGNLGRTAYREGNFAAARAWLTEALELQRSLGISDISFLIEALGELALREGNYAEARSYFEEGIALARESGRINANYWIFSFLAYTALRQGDYEQARSLFIEAQDGFKTAGLKIGVTYTLEGLASLAVAQQRPAQAAQLFAYTDATREAVDNARPPIEQADVDRDMAIIRAQLNEADFAAAQAAGRAMSMEQAIAYALESTAFSPGST
jgi:tetratricopeptide (TPR) repeat protein